MPLTLHFLVALFIRLCLVVYSVFHDAYFSVRYTDIDYQVFTDAAEFVARGASPFERQTYRYTPLLAFLLVPNAIFHKAFGKIVFCLLDVLTSALIYAIQKRWGHSTPACEWSTFLWLYNPLTAVISSRGNAESIMTFLIIFTIYLHQRRNTVAMGIIYGVSVHFKIYPCIYFLSFYFALASFPPLASTCQKLKTLAVANKNQIVFLCFSFLGFAIPTAISALAYEQYLEESLLHHLRRRDVRHNFSPLFYSLYLSDAAVLSSGGFLLQALLVFLVSWRFPRSLPAAMFLQTIVFVTFNKVCTSQYFLWYMCLLPLNYPLLKKHPGATCGALVAWLAGQSLWLLLAYLLEFQGQNVFLFLCAAGWMFFLCNIYLIRTFLMCVPTDASKRVKDK